MNQHVFLKQIQKRLAQTSIGASALRNQGSAGLVKISRDYLEKINLDIFFQTLKDETLYTKYLNRHTNQLLEKYPSKAKSWGAARKALNLFFREVVYNKFIADYYKLPNNFKKFNVAVRSMELPLDKFTGTAIHKYSNNTAPVWKSIKKLSLDDSNSYQLKADVIANGIAKIHLDLAYWRVALKKSK